MKTTALLRGNDFITSSVSLPETARDEVIASRVYKKVFWRTVPFLVLCYTVSYLDRVNVGFAKLQMARSIGLSETVFGIGAGVFFLGYFLFEIPSNLLLVRVGARLWIARIMVTWGLVSAGFIFVHSPAGFYLMRFLLGVAEAGFYPGVILYLTYWFPAHRRGRVVALFMSAIPIAGIFGNPLSGWLVESAHRWRLLQDWQWMFLIEALPAVVCGVVIVFFLDDGIRSAKWLTEEEKNLLSREIEADVKLTSKQPHLLSGVIGDGRIWFMGFIYFCFVVGQYGLTFWVPTLIQGAGIQNQLSIGLLSSIPFLVAVLAMNLCGYSADRSRERRWHLIVPALVGATGFIVVASFSHNIVMSIIALSVAAAGVLTCSPLFWSLPTAFLSGTGAAAGIAMVNSLGNLGGFASPFFVGYLRDLTHSSQAGMYVLAAILVAGAVGVWFTPAELVNH
jgi:D-galactonate transporter